jgi:hypothetical protein
MEFKLRVFNTGTALDGKVGEYVGPHYGFIQIRFENGQLMAFSERDLMVVGKDTSCTGCGFGVEPSRAIAGKHHCARCDDAVKKQVGETLRKRGQKTGRSFNIAGLKVDEIY